MKFLLIIGSTVAAAGIFLLATASADTTLFARHYPLLLGLNAALAALLATLVAYQLIAMARRYRAGVLPTVIGPWLITPRAIRLPAFPAVIAVSTGSCSSEPVGEK